MTRNKTLITTAIVALALAGCGTAATTNSTSSPSTAPPAAPASPANQAGPGGTPVVQTVREGQPFTLTGLENNAPQTWKITLDSITCGSGAIFSPAVLAAGTAATGQQPSVPQPQQPGSKFCLVKFTAVNEGNSDQPWSASSGTVNVGARAYADNEELAGNGGTGTGYAAEAAYMQEAQPHSQTSDFGLQPGTSGVSWAVFEVPQAARVTSVSVPAGASIADSAQEVITLP